MLVWSAEEFGTGVAEIDEQHKEWFARINALQDAAETGKKKAEVWLTLEFLEGYTCKHFGFEEEVMQVRNCGACRANKAAHAQFLGELEELKIRFDREGVSDGFRKQIEEKIVDWVHTHIGKIDRQLRDTASE